jgi:hypothetical protein
MARRRPETRALGDQCWQALWRNKQLAIFPAISGIATLVILAVTMVIVLGVTTRMHSDNAAGYMFVLGLVIVYVLSTFVITFCNTALVGTCLKLLRGQPATVNDGFNIALSHLSTLIGFSLLSSTVGLLTGIIRGEARESKNLLLMIVGLILSAIIRFSWDVATFLILPVIVVENLSVGKALQRSTNLFKQTWANLVLGEMTISTGACLFTALAIGIGALLIVGAAMTGSIVLIGVAVALTVLALAVVAIMVSAVNTIYRTSLYLYATTGNAGSFLDPRLVYGLFNPGMAPRIA